MIHYVGHSDATSPALTPRETLGFWAALRGTSVVEPDRALDYFGLGAVADWPCRWLSAGQRRRLALARLVAAPSAIWLLDEPNAALDRDGEARLAAASSQPRPAGRGRPRRWRPPPDRPVAGAARTRRARQGGGTLGHHRAAADPDQPDPRRGRRSRPEGDAGAAARSVDRPPGLEPVGHDRRGTDAGRKAARGAGRLAGIAALFAAVDLWHRGG